MLKPAPTPFIFKTILILILSLSLPLVISGDEKKKIDFWLPMEERIKTWDAIAGKGNYTISENGLEATFEKDGAKWTIIGANAPIVNPTVYPKDWPVKGKDFEVLVIPEPITNYKILPFTEKIENAVKSDTISITAAKDSYEPASFVIRSGDVDLKDMMIEVTDLKAKVKGKNGRIRTAIIPKENIDIRVVKCWYQAGDQLHDTKNKILKPELLLHEDGLVRIDYDKQVVLLRNYERIQDADNLKTFSVPKRQNKQIWLTVHIPEKLHHGKYSGIVRVLVKGKIKKELGLDAEVLPFALPQPMLDYALFYEGYLAGIEEPKIDSRQKTLEQMRYELRDMAAHGLTNATLWHEVNRDIAKWVDDWELLKLTLDLRQEIGWGAMPLLYLDWRNTFKEDTVVYKKKVEKIISVAKSYGINEVYIYGVDEKRGVELFALRSLYQTVREAGAKNFVAITESDFLSRASDLIDIPIFWGIPGIHIKKMDSIKKQGIKVWKYSQPQAGLEDPETYRHNYGIKLLANGFSGACNYQYQRGAWNDFADPRGRMNTMAYPTITKPIPTVEWEGWRVAVNDIRYITLLKKKNLLREDWLKGKCLADINDCRKSAIRILIDGERQ